MSNEGWGNYSPEAAVEAAPAETPEAFAARRDGIIQTWRAAIEPKKQWENYEKECRANVVGICFPRPVKGTQRYELGGGYKLKLVHGVTYTLGNKDMVDPILNEKVSIESQVRGVLEQIAALGNEGPMLADRLVKWKPELNATEYEKLSDEFDVEAKAKALIDTILTSKPASPQLTLEEPKAPK